MSALETVDVPHFDILAAGGPYFGTGSAPGGDHYTVDDLTRFAANARELASEVRIPVKLGHSPEQQLLRESGLLDEHGQPAAGWIENLRVEGDKLYADARRVPAKLAALIKAGAFRMRSVEQRRYVGQSAANRGKDYGWIIDGLALLGGKAPAVRTLDDIVALYSAPGAGSTVTGNTVRPGTGDGIYLGRDLPEIPGDPPEGVRTITFKATNLPVSIPGSRMAEATLTLTPEQTAAVAKALGAEPKDLAPEKLLAAIETATKTAVEAVADKSKTELADAKKALAAAEAKVEKLEKKPSGDSEAEKLAAELKEELKTLAARAEAGEKAAEELRVMARDTLIDGAIRGGKLEPALAEQMRKLYDAAPVETRATIEKLPKRDDLFKVYGADGADISGGSEPDESEEAKQLAVDYDRYLAAIGQTRETAGAGA